MQLQKLSLLALVAAATTAPASAHFRGKPRRRKGGAPVKVPKLPQTCAVAYDDPHMETYDGHKFDCQGSGDFVLSKSLAPNGFELQGRFRKLEVDTGLTGTTTTAAVLETGHANEPTLEVQHGYKCDYRILVDGQEQSEEQLGGNSVPNLEFFASGTKERYFVFKESGISLHLTKRYNRHFGCFLNVKLCLPDAIKNQQIVGLMGSPDGNKSNDYMDRSGTDLKTCGKIFWGQVHDYCTKTWCIGNVGNSLFDKPGSTSACGAKYDDRCEKKVKEAPPEVIEKCGKDNNACIIDAVVTGDPDFGKETNNDERELKKKEEIEECDDSFDMETNLCEMPPKADDFAVVSFGDAHIGAHSMYKGLAIGGTLYDSTPEESGTIDKTTSYIKSIDSECRFNFNSPKQVGSACMADSMQERFEYIAMNAKSSKSGEYIVEVKDQGGVYDVYDFNPAGQGSDNGKTLAIFNCVEDIYITKGSGARQFGPTIIAPFATVYVQGDAGFVDGSIYAKSVVTVDGNGKQGSLQLHGNTYSGPINCGGVGNPAPPKEIEPEPEPTCSNSHKCDCFTCDDVQVQADGSMTISIGHCKNGDISWMCCVGVDGGEGNCDVVAPCGKAKCEGVDNEGLSINVPKGSESFTINTHDGKTAGDAMNVRSVCGGPDGGQGGSCVNDATGVTAHCLMDFTIANDCPAPKIPKEPVPAPQPEPEPKPSGCQPAWAQCGGRGYEGETCCSRGTTCVEESEWYSNCKPSTKQKEPEPEPPVKVSPPMSVCESVESLDFEMDGNGKPTRAGDLAKDLWSALGIQITTNLNGKPAMLFNTGNPTGGDTDLASDTEGMVLIISEDGKSNNPDDNAKGGTINIEFTTPVCYESIGVFDMEDQTLIKMYDGEGNCIGGPRKAPIMGDGESDSLDLDTCGVYKMEVIMVGSGAITDVQYCKDPEYKEPKPEPSCAPANAQCGGITYKGPTCCETGYECIKDNDNYSGCKPVSPEELSPDSPDEETKQPQYVVVCRKKRNGNFYMKKIKIRDIKDSDVAPGDDVTIAGVAYKLSGKCEVKKDRPDSTEDTGLDSPEDTGPDSPEDTSPNSTEDTSPDSSEDTSPDSTEDSGLDSTEDEPKQPQYVEVCRKKRNGKFYMKKIKIGDIKDSDVAPGDDVTIADVAYTLSDKCEVKKDRPDSTEDIGPDSPEDSDPTSPEETSPDSTEDTSPDSTEDTSPDSPEDSGPDYPEDTSPKSPKDTSPDSISCTADAYECPDGTFVGRTGPDCEFVCPPPVPDPEPKPVACRADVYECHDGTFVGRFGPNCEFEDCPPDDRQPMEPIQSPKRGSGSGDPHFKTWTGAKYDYHGECDLVLVDNPTFANGKGLRVHIRTTRVKFFSFISKVAVQIGEDVLEFENDTDNFLINGSHVENNRKHHKTQVGGFKLRRDKKAISIRLSESMKSGPKIDLHTRKNGFPAVIVDGAGTNVFKGSLGMLGDWETGRRLARDGKTEMEGLDATPFALDWQVRGTEPMLFTESRFPQYPTTCTPPTKRIDNRLGSTHFQTEAEEACAHWKEDMEDCIFDVIATRDILVAEEGHIVHLE